jgi:hypothetical protein
VIEIQATIVCHKCKTRAPVVVTGAGKYGFVYDVPSGWHRSGWTGNETCPECSARKAELPRVWTVKA